jgi:hypothetical protein
MSRITDCIKDDLPLYAEFERFSGLLQNEEILKAIALLEANKFQVHFNPGVDIVGSLNYNIKWVSELLSEKKELQNTIEEQGIIIKLIADTWKRTEKRMLRALEEQSEAIKQLSSKKDEEED